MILTFIVIALVFLIFLYYFRTGSNIAERTFLLLSLALCQTLIFGLILFILERVNYIWLVVYTFNRDIFTAAEVGLVFFLIFLLTDFIAEAARYLLLNKSGRLNRFYIIVLSVSLLQAGLFICFNIILSESNIFGVLLRDPTWEPLPFPFFFLHIWLLILTAEIIIEWIRRMGRLH